MGKVRGLYLFTAVGNTRGCEIEFHSSVSLLQFVWYTIYGRTLQCTARSNIRDWRWKYAHCHYWCAKHACRKRLWRFLVQETADSRPVISETPEKTVEQCRLFKPDVLSVSDYQSIVNEALCGWREVRGNLYALRGESRGAHFSVNEKEKTCFQII